MNLKVGNISNSRDGRQLMHILRFSYEIFVLTSALLSEGTSQVPAMIVTIVQ